MQPGDVRETLSNTNKIYNLCGYKSETDVPSGVKNLLNGMQDILKKTLILKSKIRY